MTTKRPLRILQVDHTSSDATATALALTSTGIAHTIDVVGTGTEAIDFLKCREDFEDSLRPDFILLELSLPDVNGHDVLKFIKKDMALKAIPVVVFTNLASDEDQAIAYEHGANSYVLKPAEIDRFMAIVQSIAAYWVRTSFQL